MCVAIPEQGLSGAGVLPPTAVPLAGGYLAAAVGAAPARRVRHTLRPTAARCYGLQGCNGLANWQRALFVRDHYVGRPACIPVRLLQGCGHAGCAAAAGSVSRQ